MALRLPENPEPWLAWLAARGVEKPADFWDIYLPVTGASDRPTNAPARHGADETITAFLTDVFLDWLGEQRSSDAWFAHLSYLRPHPPFIAPEPFNTMYDPAGGPPFRRAVSAVREAMQHPLVAYWHEAMRVGAGRIFVSTHDSRVADWSDKAFRVVRAVYWGMVSEVDRQIGRVLDALAGSPRDTVILFTSDHGEMLGDHWTLGKFGYFDQSFHVPLIVSDPRRTAGHGRRVDAFSEVG